MASVTQEIIDRLFELCGKDYVLLGSDERAAAYARDETEDFVFPPEVVVKPGSAAEIAEIMKLCNAHKVPVTPRGGGTGLSGGALPVRGGIVLSTERLNRILKIDEVNRQVVTEPGVVTQVLQEAVIEKGLYYPPDPSSRGSCFIGGNIAENAGGPRAVKYGVTKDHVLNLEVVLPTGEIIETGANVVKNATGYNLTQLMVGSEGTLGIVTKIVLKLTTYPPLNLLMLVPFSSAEQACEAVSKILNAGITPSCLEFMECDAIAFTADYLGLHVDIPEGIEAHLLIETDGFELDSLYKECERIADLLSSFEIGDILLGETAAQKEQMWKIRRNISHAVKAKSIYKEEDTVVPRGELPKLLRGVKAIGERYRFRSVCYGHAGDGNLHVNILRDGMDETAWNYTVKEGIAEIFKLCKSLGGTISGEHGIGYVQRPYLPIVFGKKELELMRALKRIFDPNGILNPEKAV